MNIESSKGSTAHVSGPFYIFWIWTQEHACWGLNRLSMYSVMIFPQNVMQKMPYSYKIDRIHSLG